MFAQVYNIMKTTTAHRLTQMPDDVHDIIIDYQSIIKKKCKCQQVSLEKTIYKIVRAAKKNNINLYE